MHNSYDDILEAAGGRQPDWWDENGVPRFGEHHPDKCPDIYAGEVALVEIGCQGCKRLFRVQMSGNGAFTFIYSRDKNALFEKHPLRKRIENKALHYGDPPNVDCCGAGATMNCEDYRVLEYWVRGDSPVNWDWRRDHTLEVDLADIAERP